MPKTSEEMTRENSTEDDTGLDDDPPEPPKAKVSVEGGTGFFTWGRWKKMAIRAFMGTFMIGTFSGVIYLGHVYICILVFCLQCFIFAELVGVRKRQAAERRMPLFRSIQWAWFLVAAFYTWSGHASEFLVQSPQRFHAWTTISRFILENNVIISFNSYAALLIVSVLSLRKGLYKYQLTQYTWTVVTICIVVFQTQAVFQLIYVGLFWFVLPSCLVICNDIMAYYCGQFLGKKIIRRQFLELSPNKTWEGFLGSAVFTCIFAFWFSGKLCAYEFMTCPPDDITFVITRLSCTPAKMYQRQQLKTMLEVVLRPGIVEAIPGMAALANVELCSVQLHAICLGLFASFVAPFGGFLSSAIKRAYGIKDFASLIPGHGGMMDRFDCQFVMFLCTYVHYRTFCKAPVTLEAVFSAAMLLSLDEQKELSRRLQSRLALTGT